MNYLYISARFVHKYPSKKNTVERGLSIRDNFIEYINKNVLARTVFRRRFDCVIRAVIVKSA